MNGNVPARGTAAGLNLRHVRMHYTLQPIMNAESLKKLTGISNVEALRQAIEAMCTPVVKVRSVRLLPDRHGIEYLCFIEPDSHELNPMLIDKLGGIDYGNSIAFRIPINRARGQ